MNNRTPSIQLNMLMNVILTLSSIIFPVITLPYITRVLGAEGVGRVYFASSVIAFFAMFAELGIPVYGIRACARVRDDRAKLSQTVREIMGINLIACAVSYVCFGIALAAVPRLAEDKTLLIIMSSTMLLNALGAEWLYKALEKYTYITIRSVGFKIIALAAMFLMVREENDYLIYGCITIFAISASNIVNLLALHRYADLRPVPGDRSVRSDIKSVFARHLPGMLMLFALAAATTVYTNLDLAILDFMKGNAEAGLYGAAVRIKLVIVSLVTSVSAVLLPRNSFYYEKHREEEFFRLLSRTMKMVMIVSVPAACYFMMFAKESIQILGGADFMGAVLPMQIIMPSVIFIGISNIIGMQMLVPVGKERSVVTAAAIGAGVDLVLNFILIPHFASAGAAAATLAAEICVTAYMIHAAGKDAGKVFSEIPAGSVLTAAAVMIPAGLLIKAAGKAFIQDPTALTAFAGMCIAAVCCFGLYGLIIYRKQK